MEALPLSLIQLSSLTETMAYQANAAKLLAPFAPEASAQHLANTRTAYKQIAELLDVVSTRRDGPVLREGV